MKKDVETLLEIFYKLRPTALSLGCDLKFIEMKGTIYFYPELDENGELIRETHAGKL